MFLLELRPRYGEISYQSVNFRVTFLVLDYVICHLDTCKMIAVMGGHQHFEGTDKCYRLVGDFVTENRRYPGSWIPFGSSACLTPREWGIVGPM